MDAERLADQLEHQRPTAAIVGVARRRDDATGEHGTLAGGARCEPASACTTADVPATHVHPGHAEELHGGTGCLDLPAGPFRRTGAFKHIYTHTHTYLYIHNSCLFVSRSASLENTFSQLPFRIIVTDGKKFPRAFASTLANTALFPICCLEFETATYVRRT